MAETPPAMIGPNAILQMVPVLDQLGGLKLRTEILARAGVFELPSGDEMIPEGPAARLHQEVRRTLPDMAPALAWAAGRATADYILEHRIPARAQWLLKRLPAPMAAWVLARSIRNHAWTFAGSGQFHLVSKYCFEIEDNPVVRGEVADHPLCDWHAAVFARLFQVLVHPDFVCEEVECTALNGRACRFELRRLDGRPKQRRV
ncbi:bacteriochlorophyll 4-vinyl reductase [Aestuariivita sp.]|jgi:divinyl protochlorophyllide a 8-vinyl-reductase|uniref:bacteriochlorophyll 4-vinyl reductase n=1 Tax=Aestuariivita sp. TaxID=1872407 RepID=UPI00216EA7C0|nr:bacteriochlorophyll 4-vinyl reductase [Aestuariivita sp.]MCE8008692.1 bacteriochlorophyll 4-vinyl reductase [Aestuariivita sp.]